MAEIWDLVDKDGNYLDAKWQRGDPNKIPEGVYHPCVEVWVKINDKILITQRHPQKSEGLKYDIPGGAVVSGESILEGAVRELCEEVGRSVPADKLKLLGTTVNGDVYAASYLLTLDALPELTLQSTEVVGYMLVTQEKLEEMTDQITKGTNRRYLIYKNIIF